MASLMPPHTAPTNKLSTTNAATKMKLMKNVAARSGWGVGCQHSFK
jgi:hypothetical protein